jgi:alcohol dehydrogenase
MSEIFSREAWRLLEPNYERVLNQPDDLEARGAMQLGAFYAGVAIENSMLGATHACANPLTAHYGTAHGAAIGMLLPSVVRWNETAVGQRYESFLRVSSGGSNSHDISPTEALARRLEQLAEAGGLRMQLRAAGIAKDELSALAAEAAEQWTGTFNPRPFDRKGALEVYEWAY